MASTFPEIKIQGKNRSLAYPGDRPKNARQKHLSDRRQIQVIYLLAVIQVGVWLVLSIVASIFSYVLGVWMITTLVGKLPTDFSPVSVIVPVITGMANVLFFIQLRAANKRVDTIMDKLLGAK